MIHELQLGDFSGIWPLVQELTEFNLIIKAVIKGVAPGRVLVDNIDEPRSVYMDTPEGSFVAGYVGNPEFIASLRAKTPYLIDLRIHPDDWEPFIGEIIRTKVVGKHLRGYYTFHERRLPNWRSRIPASHKLKRVDEDTLGSNLRNIGQVTGRIDSNWCSIPKFLENGFGFCIIRGDSIISLCLSDCVIGDSCEIGVWTAPTYRGRGFATLVVAGTVEYCLSKGFMNIGWHCLDTNIGSKRVAEKVGFHRTKEYYAFSTELPAGNATDFDRETWIRWAEYYESNSGVEELFRFRAAESWALAGEVSRSVRILNGLIDDGWLTPNLKYLLYMWPFEDL